MKTKYLFAIILCPVLAVTAIYAQGPGKGKGGKGGNIMMLPVHAALDADKDGTISSEEMENATAALKALDKNGDGSLTVDEVLPKFGGMGKGKGGMSKGKGSSKGGKGSDDTKDGPKRPKIE